MRDDFLRIVGCVVLGLVILLGTLAGFQMLSVSPIWSEKGAAWVQAVGSVAALAVAIFVMARQNAHATRLLVMADERALHRRAKTMLAVMERAYMQLSNCRIGLQSSMVPQAKVGIGDACAVAYHILSELRSRFLAIPTHELGDYDLAVGVQQMTEAVTNFASLIEDWRKQRSYPTVSQVAEGTGFAQKHADGAMERFRKGMRNL